MAEDIFLILHGLGGNKPTHWQEYLYTKLTEAGKKVHYPKMPDPASPDLAAWKDRVKGELSEIAAQSPDTPLTVLTHSMGAVIWMHVAADNGANGAKLADRVLLIAPPYVLPAAPPLDMPESIGAFFPPPLDPAAIANAAASTVVIASDTDDYATFDQSAGYAAKLGVEIHKLSGGGHISPYYGYGEWPWMLEWCLRQAELPPLPNK